MRWSKFNRLSAYARADSHLVQQTSYGALGKQGMHVTTTLTPTFLLYTHTHSAVTLSGVCLAILLFFSEVGRYRSASRVTTVSFQVQLLAQLLLGMC